MALALGTAAQDNSENVRGRNYCVNPEANNQEACTDPPISSRWEFREPHRLDTPECAEVPFSRDNHHGVWMAEMEMICSTMGSGAVRK